MATISNNSIVRALSLVDTSIKTKSFTKTAEKIGMKQSNVSSYIREFEEFLDVKLFTKTSRGVTPTHHALEIQKYARRFDIIMLELHNYKNIAHAIEGDINLWTTDGIGYCLMPYITEYQKHYPDVKVELFCTNAMPNFSNREADVAITYIPPKNYDPIHFEEYKIKFGLFASTDYIARYGLPKDIDDLIKNHRICDRKEYNNTWNEWRSIITQAKHVVSNCNSTAMLIKATIDGMGIGLHPLKYGLFEPGMELLNIDLNMEHSCWVICHTKDQTAPKIKLFLDEIDKCLCLLSGD